MLYNRKAAIENSEKQLQEIQLEEIFKPSENLVIFDIGACEGENSIRYSRLFTNSKVFAFEPMPANFEIIQRNLTQYPDTQISPFEFCLSNKIGGAEFYVSSGKPDEFKEKEVDWEFGNKSSSLLAPHKTLEEYEWLEFKKKITVATERLDNFMKEHKISQIDFVHMDVQGAELMVLEGAGEKLNTIKNIWLEVATVPFYKGQPIKKDIERFFKNNGYVKLVDTYEAMGDQFWSNKDWIINKMGVSWVENRIKEINKSDLENKISFIERLRNKIQFRTRLKKLFKN